MVFPIILERWFPKLKLGENEKGPCQDDDPVKDVPKSTSGAVHYRCERAILILPKL
jgi:hypothetical protein